MPQILNYSDSEFPSLESSTKKINVVKKKTVLLPSNVNVNLNSVSDSSSSQNPEKSSESNVFLPNQTNGQLVQLPKKVLKPNKHKETYSVAIRDLFKRYSAKPTTRCRIKSVKRLKNDIIPGGNPLDADNPIRIKTKINVRIKPKRISKIKTLVYKSREDFSKLRELASNIFIRESCVFVNSAIPVDVWKLICLLKARDVKQALSRGSVNHENTVDCGNSVGSDSSYLYIDEKSKTICKNSLSELENCENGGEKGNAIPLKKVLNSSTIPPYKLLIHHHNFKRYCDNCITNELNRAAEALISQIVRFQYNKYQVNPIKAVANKRYVLGLRQVKKYIKLNKIKLMILVPDMEDSICDVIEELKLLASTYCIPYFFALSRRKLGFLNYKKVGVSCFGILDHSGAEENLSKTLAAATLAKKYYKENCSQAEEYYQLHFGETLENHRVRKDLSEIIIEDFQKKLSLKNDDQTIGNAK